MSKMSPEYMEETIEDWKDSLYRNITYIEDLQYEIWAKLNDISHYQERNEKIMNQLESLKKRIENV